MRLTQRDVFIAAYKTACRNTIKFPTQLHLSNAMNVLEAIDRAAEEWYDTWVAQGKSLDGAHSVPGKKDDGSRPEVTI